MRPVKTMIEFKQIIGRGTRLFDGKDYFTVYDYVKAYEHFNDEEWDGEPLEPEPCKRCANSPCICETRPQEPCKICGQLPCECEPVPPEPCKNCGEAPCICEKKIKIKLADGKELTIQHMLATTFWDPDGKPMSATEFIKRLYGDLPDLFKDEDELRALWSKPDTRKRLLSGLEEKGYGKEQLVEVGRLIDAEKSDLYDVLAYIAFTKSPMTREERALGSKTQIGSHYDYEQQEFLSFVLDQYIKEGVGELDQDKLPDLLELKYHAVREATDSLGDVSSIRKVFIGFQQYLYQDVNS